MSKNLTPILLPTEIAVIKIEAHTKRTELTLGNTLADFSHSSNRIYRNLWHMWMECMLLLQKTVVVTRLPS